MNSLRKPKQLKLNLGPVADEPASHSFEEFIASHLSESPTGQVRLMESICERSNMKRAVKRVVKNKGAPGVDGMTVRQVKRYLQRHWPKIKQALMGGTYDPMPVRRKQIPKQGGVRLLGIPTALDRVIQQATAQVLAQIKDKRVLKLVRGFLTSGVMIAGLEQPTRKGTAQGGPLSPLLSKA